MAQAGGIQSLTIGASFILFAVWMQRQGRWSLFFQAMSGTAVINGARSSSPSENGVSNPPGVTGGGNEPGAPISPPTAVPPNVAQQNQPGTTAAPPTGNGAK